MVESKKAKHAMPERDSPLRVCPPTKQGQPLDEGLYMYCVIENPEREEFGPLGLGDPRRLVYTISHKDLACLVSQSPLKEYPVSRDNSMAHQEAIEEAMKNHAVLPVRFSTIAVSEEAIVEKVLKPRYEEFKNLLAWISDKSEKGLKLYWLDTKPVFAEILEHNEAVRAKKEEIQSQPREKSYLDHLDIGKMVEASLKEKKKAIESAIMATLNAFACDSKTHPPYGDNMILSAAFLVERKKEEAFFIQIRNLEQKHTSNVKFKYVQGAPPFNFVNIVIKWDAVEAA